MEQVPVGVIIAGCRSQGRNPAAGPFLREYPGISKEGLRTLKAGQVLDRDFGIVEI